MNRVIISKNLQWYKYLLVAIVAVLVYIYTIDLQNSDFNPNNLFIFLIFPIICLYLAYQSHQSKQVSFDENYMYLTLRENEEMVPLKNVKTIKLTLTSISRENLWNITYLDRDGHTKSLKILPKWEGSFQRFQRVVAEQNPNAQIKNSADSWTFD